MELVLEDATEASAEGVFFWSAMYGAAVNVKVNTKAMQDRAYAEQLNHEVDHLMELYRPIAEAVYENVYRRFC